MPTLTLLCMRVINGLRTIGVVVVSSDERYSGILPGRDRSGCLPFNLTALVNMIFTGSGT